jgi:hypothetical protein
MVYETTDPVMVAGHRFDNLTDRCVNISQNADGRGVCGKHRVRDVHPATRADIGKSGYSCVPTLNETEFAQIQVDIVRVQADKDRAYSEIAVSVGAE